MKKATPLDYLKVLALPVALVFAVVFQATPPNMLMSEEEKTASEQSAYYPRCSAARAAGKAPLYRGDPGYRPELDADNDGIACEPYPRHRRW